MRRTLSLTAALAALLVAGCGSQGPTVAQRCHSYAVRQAQAQPAVAATTVAIWQELCIAHPKLLSVRP